MLSAAGAGASPQCSGAGIHRGGDNCEKLHQAGLSPGHKLGQGDLVPIRSLSLSLIAITFSPFLTLVYNLIVACPDFASLQTYILNAHLLPSNLHFILLLITLPEACFSQKHSMASHSLQ